MLSRIADLTWRRPRLVLALVAVFALGAGAFGYDVEHHLKADECHELFACFRSGALDGKKKRK